MIRKRLIFNSPVILSFVAVCFLARILSIITGGRSDEAVFSVYRSPLADPLTYIRCICHVFGHIDWDHLLGNMMYLLILGPMLEEKYGSRGIARIMLMTAVVTGIINMVFFPRVMLLGASGIIFAFILLSSITSSGEDGIPVTFILVAVMYIGSQIYDGMFTRDSVSQLTHIVGGAVGTAAGFAMNRTRGKRAKR